MISAHQSLRISSSVSSGVLLMTSPFSLARCKRQMKQKLVEMSSMTVLGYTVCRSFITSVNLSRGPLSLSDAGIPASSPSTGGVGSLDFGAYVDGSN